LPCICRKSRLSGETRRRAVRGRAGSGATPFDGGRRAGTAESPLCGRPIPLSVAELGGALYNGVTHAGGHSPRAGWIARAACVAPVGGGDGGKPAVEATALPCRWRGGAFGLFGGLPLWQGGMGWFPFGGGFGEIRAETYVNCINFSKVHKFITNKKHIGHKYMFIFNK